MKKKNVYKKTLVRGGFVIPLALAAMGFMFAHAQEGRQEFAYDETFSAGQASEVRMSLAAAQENAAENTLSLPFIGSAVYGSSQEFTFGPFTAARPFILLSAQWDESRAEDLTNAVVEMRTRTDGHAPWSAWQALERLKDFRDERDLIPGRVRTEPLIVDESREFEARVTLTTADPRVTPQVSNLTFTTVGTENDTPSLNLPLTKGRNSNGNNQATPPNKGEDRGESVKAALNGTSELNIISRASWASDESLHIDKDGNPAWPETYGEVKAFIVHHTGGTNGGADPAATIRAIQRYHGKTLGWGDIGYNYLIAPDGRIYEGRTGGEGVVGGHTYNDKKKLGYNTGSVGIAVLGNYEGKDALTGAAKESLARLIAEKSFEHEVAPNGETTLKDIAIPTVIAHRDVDATICPGSGITAELLQVRQLARANLDAMGGLAAITRKATLIQQSDTSILIKPGQTKTIWVIYRNDGNTNWKNYLTQPVQLADAAMKSRLAALPSSVTAAFINSPSAFRQQADPRDIPIHRVIPTEVEGSLGDARDDQAGVVKMAQVVDDEIRPIESTSSPINALTFVQPNVAPGQTVTIPITVTVPTNAAGVIERDYVLAWGTKGYFPGTDFHIAVETTEMEWAGKLESLKTPTSTRAGIETQGVVRVRNRGVKTWLKGSVMLLLTDVAGGEPKWNVAGWPLPMGRILFNEAMIRPNDVATFPLPLTATSPGLFETLLSFKYLPDVGTVPSTLIETLQLPNLPGAEGSFATTVIPSGQIELMKPNFPTRMRPGRTVYFTLRVKNTGDKILKGGKGVYLTQTAADGSKSPFYVKSDWLSDTKPASLWQPTVKPGKEGSFTWRMKAPAIKGMHTETLTFTTSDGGGLINGKSTYTFTIKVE
ncbi:hypothetical protein A3J43_03730 [Candidatus Uhrbacteria bacterium RIFCSPHIGHO2_12_FULL_54_23]|uniref:Peptidoglycan recognition protein family domain-containing protein n=3 Tax=Candidatus Uhriibacteriota TaxID=1752732 RepID=A0A1F7UI65_9BACT|nr:MAG: hypothetical protein A3J43_03730 [Candidatus Uhrbacteria bacterium RIFCSPHIGHO2_12_FULL_54_23]OGL83528.1 MAG: hypothetical protein A3B36_01450 [Candidatus Uhrbacteria bacterium RIFCSPLOWO2_01_FULL_55_36]OGL89724.1 MAG: hypothetical protein A3J36_02765 [Candidatus Uhrbacteria bacterium RIFCSPLOWO2_02_FULL_54_37]